MLRFCSCGTFGLQYLLEFCQLNLLQFFLLHLLLAYVEGANVGVRLW